MRILLLLRGSAGCGKSTWIQNNGLKQYTLSADDIRLLCQSPIMKADGTQTISVSNDGTVWKMLFQILEVRMRKGEFTVIDATNSKTSEMNQYKKLCDEYRYRMYCVDFTDIPIEETKRRNLSRPEYKRVPEEVIDNMYSRFKTQKIPSGIKVIRPDQLSEIWIKRYDLSEYKRIHHIGDIHGCYTVLQEYLTGCGGLKDDEFYIFLGDYIDRGIENVEILNFLISVAAKKNVLLLEGNHERWLWKYANDEISRSRQFELVTKPEIEESGIKKKNIRKLYRRFAQCAYYEYNGNVYVVTHGGLSTVPENLSFVATEQMIKGVGNYKDYEEVENTFIQTTPDNFYQIHGHRNVKGLPMQVNDRVFNLEGRVEFGGSLRCVQVDSEGIHTVETKNNVFKPQETDQAETILTSSIADAVISLRSNKYIREKNFGKISSFNFTEKAFYDKEWNDQTIKARGLYIDTEKGKVVARSYPKFFNINERVETRFENLQDSLKFPITAYVKENGFLGIVSYDEYADDLFIASKSTIDSQNAEWLKDMIYSKVSLKGRNKMLEFAKNNHASFVFECVDMEHDPHIIKYAGSSLYLLDIVKNDMDFYKYEYEEMCDIAIQIGVQPKERAYEIATWNEFCDWYDEILNKDYLYNGRVIEGFVIEDLEGKMVKVKLTYYNFWKFMRSIAQEIIKIGTTKRTSQLTSPVANEFYLYMKELVQNTEDKESIPTDICTLRDMFLEDKIISLDKEK